MAEDAAIPQTRGAPFTAQPGTVWACHCGWQSKPTTSARAKQAYASHSCELHRARQARAARVRARNERDEPRRDCTHPRARHQHGTRTAYVLDRCRCRPCREANNASQRAYQALRARQAWGQAPDSYVDAEPVRDHVRALMVAGVGWKRIAHLSGVPTGALSRLLYGKGRSAPSTRVRPAIAQRLLAVTADGALAGGALVDAAGTRRRLQALAALGWSLASLGRMLDIAPTNMPAVLERTHVRADTARAVKNLYERLWGTPPPQRDRFERATYTKARKQAAAKAWLPPMAWDDDLIDLPDEQLRAQCDRRAAQMSDEELRAAWTSRYTRGDTTPLTTAAAREHERRRKARKTGRRAGAAA